MKKFFSLSSIKESIRFRDKKNSTNQLDEPPIDQTRITGKRFSNLSTNSLSSKQSYLNIEVIREGYNVDLTRVDHTFTKLHRACLLNYDEKKLLKYIKKQPANINQIDNVAHCSPLHLCVVNNNINYLSILLDNGGDVNLYDGQGKTLLIKAIECKNEQIIQYLLARHAEVNKPDLKYKNTPLHVSCLTAYFKGISILLNCTHINVNLTNSNKETILHLIAKSSKNLYVFINDCLDNNGIDIDSLDIKGRTPLFCACLNGNYRCVELLLNNNANPTINNQIGESPLSTARSKGFVDIVDLFENNTTNQYLRKMKHQETAETTMNNHQTNFSKSTQDLPVRTTNDAKRTSVFSFNSDADFMKSKNDEEDSWPETISDISVGKKQSSVLVNPDDQNSFNSFKMNPKIPATRNSISLSTNSSNEFKNQVSLLNKNTGKISLENDQQEIKNNVQSEEVSRTKPILYPENDKFIEEMKFMIDEEIKANEELDEMLITKQLELDQSNKKQALQSISNQMTSIYFSDSDEDWDENDTLIKKSNSISNQEQTHINQSNSSLRKQSLTYGLSEDEQPKINATKTKDESSDESLSQINQINQIHRIQTLDKIYPHSSNQLDNQITNGDQQDSNSDEHLTQKSINQVKNKSNNFERNTISITDSSLSSAKSLKEDELIDKFDTLMSRINDFEQQNQRLSIELSEALDRENELKLLNNELNRQFEEQNQQLIALEDRLKQSEKNHQLIKMESEQFKDDFKIEREKFEKEFVNFIQEEHKQTERYLMKLLDDKQEMCNKLTDELNYLKDRYVNREQIPFANDDLIKKLESNQLFIDLIQQNERINDNFQQLQKFLVEHEVLMESIKKLNQILVNLEDQVQQQSSQINKKLNNQQNEFSEFIETNVVQCIQNLFKNEVEMKLVQVKSVVDDLKQELIDFIHNYKLPKNNEKEVTDLINQILIKSVKHSSIINNQITNCEEELRNESVKNELIKNSHIVPNDDKVRRDSKDEESNFIKDDEKTSLEFNADDLFEDDKVISDREIEIKRIKKEKIKLNDKRKKKKERLIGQYSDAVLNSIDLDRNLVEDLNDCPEYYYPFERLVECRQVEKRKFKNSSRLSNQLRQSDSSRNQFNFHPQSNNHYSNDSNHVNHLFNHLNYLNQFNHSKFIPSKSKPIDTEKAKDNLISVKNQFNSMNFHKQRQLIEQDILNLKLNLNLT